MSDANSQHVFKIWLTFWLHRRLKNDKLVFESVGYLGRSSSSTWPSEPPLPPQCRAAHRRLFAKITRASDVQLAVVPDLHCNTTDTLHVLYRWISIKRSYGTNMLCSDLKGS